MARKRYQMKINGRLLDNESAHAYLVPVIQLDTASKEAARMGGDPANLFCLNCDAEPDCMVQTLEIAQLGFDKARVVVICRCVICLRYSGVEFDRVEEVHIGSVNRE